MRQFGVKIPLIPLHDPSPRSSKTRLSYLLDFDLGLGFRVTSANKSLLILTSDSLVTDSRCVHPNTLILFLMADAGTTNHVSTKKEESLSISHEGARRAVGRQRTWAGVNVSGPNERAEEHQ